jgi:hypothetical protein
MFFDVINHVVDVGVIGIIASLPTTNGNTSTAPTFAGQQSSC